MVFSQWALSRLPPYPPFSLCETRLDHLAILDSFYRPFFFDTLVFEAEIHKSPSRSPGFLPSILFSRGRIYGVFNFGAKDDVSVCRSSRETFMKRLGELGMVRS